MTAWIVVAYIRAAADPLPEDLRDALLKIRTDRVH